MVESCIPKRDTQNVTLFGYRVADVISYNEVILKLGGPQ